MDASSYVCIYGNDAVGKSTLVKLLNERYEKTHVYYFERSTKVLAELQQIKDELQLQNIDNMTLLHTFEQRLPLVEYVNDIPVYHIIIDSSIENVENRITKRSIPDKFETSKAIRYYKKRFLEIASYFGLPVINNDGDIESTINEILSVSKYYSQYRELRLETMTHDKINNLNIINKVLEYMDEHISDEKIYEFISQERKKYEIIDIAFNCDYIKDEDICKIGKTMYAKHILKEGKLTIDKDIIITFDGYDIVIDAKIVLFPIVEGESKQIYTVITNPICPYATNLLVCLKPSIYSHSMQSTANIDGLEKIRALGSQLCLEMFWRNDISHSYVSMSPLGIAYSTPVQITPIEIVFKRMCIGTDKHSYYRLLDTMCVDENGEYSYGPYIRFDWRNPNHTINGKSISENPYYYTLENYFGKENFFKTVIKNPLVKPMGDKAISYDILDDILDVKKSRAMLLKIYATLQYYFQRCGYIVNDACFMLNKTGECVWSEVNPDCMRIVREDKTSVDKDIWRTTGDKSMITSKWTMLHEDIIKYLNGNHFHETEINDFTYPVIFNK